MQIYRKKLGLGSDSGFTIVEILVIILVIGILSTILVLTYSGIQVRERNSTRIANIKLTQSHLETFYAQSGYYPDLSQLNDPSWVTINLKGTDQTTLRDPSIKVGILDFSSAPTKNQYSYQPTSSDGVSPCDNKTVTCAKYTLTATLEANSGTFVEKSLN